MLSTSIVYYSIMGNGKYYLKRRDATCPITAEATHIGGGGKSFKLVMKNKQKSPSTPVSPGRARRSYNIQQSFYGSLDNGTKFSRKAPCMSSSAGILKVFPAFTEVSIGLEQERLSECLADLRFSHP